MSERRRARAVLEFRRAARAALEAGEPLEGLRAQLQAAAGEVGAQPPEDKHPARFDRPGAGE